MVSKVNVLGVGISNLTAGELNSALLEAVRTNTKTLSLNVNIHAMNLAYRHPWLKEFFNSAPILFCDGDGVRMGAKLLGIHIIEKITYNRWIWEFAEFSKANNLSWYLVGSTESVINLCVERLSSEYPELRVLGWRNGFFKSQQEITATVNEINSLKPDILILGMGMPVQEQWLKENWEQLDVRVALTGGAVFDYVAGKTAMTPDIFYKLKLEWFYRFLQEPRRLFKRYFVGNTIFMLRILKAKYSAGSAK